MWEKAAAPPRNRRTRSARIACHAPPSTPPPPIMRSLAALTCRGSEGEGPGVGNARAAGAPSRLPCFRRGRRPPCANPAPEPAARRLITPRAWILTSASPDHVVMSPMDRTTRLSPALNHRALALGMSACTRQTELDSKRVDSARRATDSSVTIWGAKATSKAIRGRRKRGRMCERIAAASQGRAGAARQLLPHIPIQAGEVNSGARGASEAISRSL